MLELPSDLVLGQYPLIPGKQVSSLQTVDQEVSHLGSQPLLKFNPLIKRCLHLSNKKMEVINSLKILKAVILPSEGRFWEVYVIMLGPINLKESFRTTKTTLRDL